MPGFFGIGLGKHRFEFRFTLHKISPCPNTYSGCTLAVAWRRGNQQGRTSSLVSQPLDHHDTLRINETIIFSATLHKAAPGSAHFKKKILVLFLLEEEGRALGRVVINLADWAVEKQETRSFDVSSLGGSTERLMMIITCSARQADRKWVSWWRPKDGSNASDNDASSTRAQPSEGSSPNSSRLDGFAPARLLLPTHQPDDDVGIGMDSFVGSAGVEANSQVLLQSQPHALPLARAESYILQRRNAVPYPPSHNAESESDQGGQNSGTVTERASFAVHDWTTTTEGADGQGALPATRWQSTRTDLSNLSELDSGGLGIDGHPTNSDLETPAGADRFHATQSDHHSSHGAENDSDSASTHTLSNNNQVEGVMEAGNSWTGHQGSGGSQSANGTGIVCGEASFDGDQQATGLSAASIGIDSVQARTITPSEQFEQPTAGMETSGLTSDTTGLTKLIYAHKIANLRIPCHAIKLEGVVDEPNMCALVMRYYKRGSLQAAIVRGDFDDMTDYKKLVVAQKIAFGMFTLHDRKPAPIIHGDLKTSNILIEDSGFGDADDGCGVVITDFGLARCLRKGQMGQVVESGAATVYISPPAGDVYAFSMVLLEIMTSIMPFKFMRDREIFAAVKGGGRPLIPDSVPLQVANIIEACWRQHPRHRPNFATILTMLHSAMQACKAG